MAARPYASPHFRRGRCPHRAAGTDSETLKEISPCGASFFLSYQKETKESPGDVAFGKDLRLRPRSFMSHIPPDPCFTWEPEVYVSSRVRRGNLMKGAYAYSLPFCSIDESGAPTRYNAPKWCNIATRRAATWGRPYGKRIFFGVRPPWGNSTKGAEAPFWSFQGDRVLRERWKFEIPLSLSGSLVTFGPHRKSLARRRNIP